MSVEARPSQAKGFYSDKYTEAAKQALKFAGKDGRLATLPDVIDARLATPLGKAPWEVYFSTNSAEYFGFSRGEIPLIVVAHGVGPMASSDGQVAAYASQLKTRRKEGGRISQKDFQKLVDGQFGEVTIVDFRQYSKRYEFPFLESLRVWEALDDTLVRARLGPRSEEYLPRHQMECLVWARQENERRKRGEVIKFGMRIGRPIKEEDLKVISVGDPSNNPYKFKTPDDAPLAHSLGIGQLSYLNGDSLHTEVYCREFLDPARMVGIKGKGPIKDIAAAIPALH